MERGTDRERAAVERRWRELEREAALASSQLGGLALLLAGVVALGLAAAREACAGDAGMAHHCTDVAPGVAAVVLTAVGAVAVAAGLWRLVGARR